MRYSAIIISGVPGSGKDVLSEILSKEIGWKIQSIGGIWRKRYSDWIKNNPDNKISFEEYWKSQDEATQMQVNIEARKLLELGRLILDSRFSVAYAGDLPVLKIFLTADLEIRAGRAFRIGKYGNRSLEEIKNILLNRESDELSWGKKLYGNNFDYRKRELYDLILDTGKVSIEEEVEEILKKLSQAKAKL